MIPPMGTPQAQEPHDPRVWRLKAALLAVWAAVAFVFFFFARDLQFVVAGWPLGYWMGAQGAVLVFIGIVAVDAAVMKRLVPEDSQPAEEGSQHA
jgi:putative solute:sodium symporter small subunit